MLKIRTALDTLGSIIDSAIASFAGRFTVFTDVDAITYSRDGKGEVHSRE
jgi:hypothetical protein